MKKNAIVAIFCMAIVLTGCEKEEVVSTQNTVIPISSDATSKLIKFENADNYICELKHVCSLSLDELIEYEDLKGYKSLRRVAEEEYAAIDFESFKTQNDIIEFVNQSQYLELIEDDKGEFELEIKLNEFPEAYFLNADQMFQVGNFVHKATEKGIISCNVDDINLLYDITGDNVLDFAKDTVTFCFETLKLDNYSSKGACGRSRAYRSESGKNRLKLEFSLSKMLNGGGVYDRVKCHYIVRPYKKTLGVWYHCSRTMKANLDFDFRYMYRIYVSGGSVFQYGTGTLNLNRGYTYTSKFEDTEVKNADGINVYNNYEFTSFDVYADTYDVDEIDKSCQ